MARPKTNKLYRTFSKGLITEAGFLTYPENASTDELNTVIKTKGSRSRRFGIDWEPSSIQDAIDSAATQTSVSSVYAWRNVNNNSATNLLCVQIDGIIYFYNMDNTPITGTRLPFTIDLTTHASPTGTAPQIKGTPVQMASGKGFLFISSQYIEPLIVEYSSSGGGSLTVTNITIQIRDFDGVNDNLANEIQPASLSNEHYYNLRNQGWVQPGPHGVVDGTPTTPYSGSVPPGSDTGVGGGGKYYDDYGGDLQDRR